MTGCHHTDGFITVIKLTIFIADIQIKSNKTSTGIIITADHGARTV
jgi:hypothetical protein